MTDKENIIDGVNVSGCCKQGETMYGITCGLPERIRFGNKYIYKHTLCKDNPDCNFKQLSRKIAECEHWKHQAELGCDTTDRLSKELEQKEQECQQLIEENHYLTKFHDKKMSIHPFSYDCDCSSDENIKNYGCYLESIDKDFTLLVKDVFRLQDIAEVPKDMGLYPLGIAHKLNSYRHALDEIEEICQDWLTNEYYCYTAKQIQDIIDKAKGNNNETSET